MSGPMDAEAFLNAMNQKDRLIDCLREAIRKLSDELATKRAIEAHQSGWDNGNSRANELIQESGLRIGSLTLR